MAELSPPFLRRRRRKVKGGESQQGRQEEGLSVEFRAREERELEDEALSLGWRLPHLAIVIAPDPALPLAHTSS